jgi:hypothetical protein
MISGSCCCGAIAFEIAEPPSMMGTCHCSRCRKLGASTFVFVRTAAIRIISGEDHLAHYRPEAPYKYTRSFCRKCGTAVGELDSTEAAVPISANCLDGDPGVRNKFHEFVSEKPEWYQICDSAQQFSHHPG